MYAGDHIAVKSCRTEKVRMHVDPGELTVSVRAQPSQTPVEHVGAIDEPGVHAERQFSRRHICPSLACKFLKTESRLKRDPRIRRERIGDEIDRAADRRGTVERTSRASLNLHDLRGRQEVGKI